MRTPSAGGGSGAASRRSTGGLAAMGAKPERERVPAASLRMTSSRLVTYSHSDWAWDGQTLM
eukprot:15463191-Alexandrium_andersonii.AAC.1